MRVVDLDRDDIRAGLADDTLLVIDVREPHEYAQGRIPGAVPHPLSTFDTGALADLLAGDGRRPVFACAAGIRSVHALAAAQQAGLDIDAHYAGGFKDWYGSGETIET